MKKKTLISKFISNQKITAKFTADAISTVAYGLETNAIADDTSDFLQVSHKLFTPSYWKLWFITFKSVFPYLFKYYEMPFVTPDIEKFFINLTADAVQLRQQQAEKPDDYLNFLLKLKEKRNYGVTDVAANAITFFLDAYETSSIVLTHALYQLAKNPHCQAKLRQEIADCNGNIDFEVLSNLEYLDHVFNGIEIFNILDTEQIVNLLLLLLLIL